MIKHLRILPFVAGLVIGIVGLYFVDPDKEVTYKYPLPNDREKTVYKDKNGVCYQYDSTEVDCDKNEAKLKPFPLSR